MPENGNGSPAASKMIPVALIGTLLAGGVGGTSIMGDNARLQDQLVTMNARTIELRQERDMRINLLVGALTEQERRVVELITGVNSSAAQRSRRIRTELQSEIDDLFMLILELTKEAAESCPKP